MKKIRPVELREPDMSIAVAIAIGIGIGVLVESAADRTMRRALARTSK